MIRMELSGLDDKFKRLLSLHVMQPIKTVLILHEGKCKMNKMHFIQKYKINKNQFRFLIELVVELLRE
jgi:hypothetical protein